MKKSFILLICSLLTYSVYAQHHPPEWDERVSKLAKGAEPARIESDIRKNDFGQYRNISLTGLVT